MSVSSTQYNSVLNAAPSTKPKEVKKDKKAAAIIPYNPKIGHGTNFKGEKRSENNVSSNSIYKILG